MEKAVYQRMAELEEHHWWFAARRHLIATLISRLQLPANCRILEVGCGTGGNTLMLQQFGEVTSIEPDAMARQLAQDKGHGNIIEGSLPNGLPDSLGKFDLVVALDVLEHIDEDAASMATLSSHLNPNGHGIFSVPAFSWLFSQHDTIHHHKRRYSKKQFAQLLSANHWQINMASYFNFWLFPLALLIRSLKSLLRINSHDDSMPSSPVNALLRHIMASERFMLGKVWIPFGLSIAVVASATTPATQNNTAADNQKTSFDSGAAF